MPTKFAKRFVLCCVAHMLLIGTSRAENGRGNMLKVMSFNIRYDNPADGPDAWPVRRDWIAEIIRSEKVDVAGLQEALRGQVADLVNRLEGYRYYGVGRDDGEQAGEFAPIFFRKDRLKLLDKGTFWLSQSPQKPGSKSWDAAITRLVSWVKLQDKRFGRSLYVFNTHFDHRGRVARENSAKLLLRKIRKRVGETPVVVTGDFNCTPASKPYGILTAEATPKTRILRDAKQASRTPHQGPDSTWNGFDKIVAKRRIDFIFVGGTVTVASHRILNFQRDGRFPSDHFPVVAEVSLSAAK